jgi:hypothetical protein
MSSKKMKYIGQEEREIAQFGVFKPGDVVEYDESLHDTGLFRVVRSSKEQKEGEK